MLNDEKTVLKNGYESNAVPPWKARSFPDRESSPVGADPDRSQGTESAGAKNLKIPKRDLIYFIGQLAIMFDTGLNLITALDCLAQQARNPAFEELVKNIRASISQGKPLWIAMSLHPRIFSPICVGMVRAGEISGTMGEMLDRLEMFLERENDIRINVRSALSYPLFMLVLSMGVLVFLLTYVFPKFEGLFGEKRDLLPLPTKFFLTLSHISRDYWYLLLPAIVLLAGTAIWAWHREESRKHLDPLFLKIPLLGDLLARMSLSRSFHTLALMLEGGIPTLEALRMAKDVAGNMVFREAWGKVAVEVENGRDIVGPLRSTPKISPSEIQMISMGDQSGRLSQVLTKLSHRSEREVDIAVKSLIRFVEPALVIVMGFLVGMIVLSLILPIFAMSRVAS